MATGTEKWFNDAKGFGFGLTNDLMTLCWWLLGYAAESDKSRAFAAGFDYHLTKPLSLEKLQSLLANRADGKLGGTV
ncbi:hypothetical protein OKW43_005699 [Paraburkholderia sp. WC7.3g]|uniref:Response regulatory domain-containing protein n=2 Tax=Burkholderiaceae TaxID=119060 RepID=A0ABR7Q1S1_9BURK|nr:hypothetical protein [Paraburkholderia podalyriae]